ncbi:hypothetical protein HOF40_02170 [Candidatus Parcubacteria bacterium]|nr:hypothetical protein [Candidatus Parcubacteria bacterium]MBT3948870.1 hypothetical protein [Candidatus Parcubacteria bacterium]
MNQLSNIINDRVDNVSDNLSSISTFATMQNDEQNDTMEMDMTDRDLSPQVKEVHDKPKTNLDIDQIKKTIQTMKDQLDSVLRLLNGDKTAQKTTADSFAQESTTLDSGEKIVEGVFDGEKMIGADGKEYTMSPNYASKSKIVEGDLMKVTITKEGRFIFKQIGPVDRKRVVGELVFDEGTQIWSVLHENKNYKVLPASVTFYKGKPGDEVVVLIPQGNHCDWGAVENIISK